MAIWNKTTKKPQHLTRAEKRNVIATDKGFVRRKSYTDVHSNVRAKDEVLVAIGGLANSTNFGAANIDDVWHSVSSNMYAEVSTAANGVTVNTWISFNEPVSQSGLAGRLRISVANTISGNNMVAKTVSSTVYETNKVLFRWKPGVVGTYKVQAQTAANATATAANTRSLNAGTELVSWVIDGPTSNTGGTFVLTS